eukprot:10289749-Heterocapsa_arctica.AAC.1
MLGQGPLGLASAQCRIAFGGAGNHRERSLRRLPFLCHAAEPVGCADPEEEDTSADELEAALHR